MTKLKKNGPEQASSESLPVGTTPSELERHTSRLKALKDLLEPWQWAAGLSLAIIVTLFFTIPAWIEHKARQAVLDERFLGEMAARIRPACVFDTNGAVHTQIGTENYINRISVLRTNWTFFITIDCKRHLNYPPLIQCFTAPLETISSERLSGYSWRIKLAARVLYSEENIENPLFKLEILH